MKKYLSLSSEPLDLSDIRQFEARFGVLPAEYKSLLIRENGGVARMKKNDERLLFYRIAEGSNDLREKWSECPPGFLLPIAEDVSHQKLLIDRNNGAVFFGGCIVADCLEEFFLKYCEPIVYDDVIHNYIANNNHEELKFFLDSHSIVSDYVLDNGFTLPQYAAALGNEKALDILANYGFSFKGTLHLILKIGMVNRPLIRAVLAGGVDLNEKNANGLKVTDLDSPWVKHIVELSME